MDASERTYEEGYIYADNAATTPLSPRALKAMMPFLTERFGNPSGIHRVSREAARALEKAREGVGAALGATGREIYFTSGGSEADTWILTGAVRRFRDLYGDGAPARLVTSSIEHHAILHTSRSLERSGVETIYLPVDKEGFVSPEALENALRDAELDNERRGIGAPAAALVSIMLANNEIGTIEAIAGLARIAHAHRVPFHTDAVQAAGHIPIDVNVLGIDSLSLSGHKFHGPRGTGALFLREGFSIPPLIMGGAQERGERAGTENVAGVVGLAEALTEASEDIESKARRVAELRDRLVRQVIESVGGVELTGPSDSARRLPSIASFVCHDVDGELLTVLLDRAGVAAATGSACSTGSTDPSHVISAIGITDPAWSHGSLRLSLSDDVCEDDIDALAARTITQIRRARLMSAS